MTPTDLEALRERVRVKPLEWTPFQLIVSQPWGDPDVRQTIGHHRLGPYAGSYQVEEVTPGGMWGWWCSWTSDRYPEGVERTADEAKAACQTDFETRILSALIAQKVEG